MLEPIADWVSPRRLGPRFRGLVVSTWLTNLGDGMAMSAGPLLVAAQTRDPALVAGAAMVQVAPTLLFGLYAGAVADRVDRKWLLIGSDLSRVALLGVLVTFIATGHVNIWVVLATLFSLGFFETFADSTGPALLPMVVERDDLGVANAKLLTGYVTFNQLLGPPMGAFLFGVGLIWPFVGQMILMALGSAVLVRLSFPKAQARPTTHVRHDIAAGVRWLVGHPAVRTLALTIVTFNVAFGIGWSVLVLYAQDRLGLGNIGFGLLTTVSAVGGILGTSIYPWLEKRLSLGRIMQVGLLWETISHALFGWTTSAWVAMAVMFLFGVHAFIWATTSTAVRQRAVPIELQGRVGATYRIGMYGGLLLGQAIGGIVARHWGVAAPFWVAFVCSAVILLFMWRQLPQIGHDAD